MRRTILIPALLLTLVSLVGLYVLSSSSKGHAGSLKEQGSLTPSVVGERREARSLPPFPKAIDAAHKAAETEQVRKLLEGDFRAREAKSSRVLKNEEAGGNQSAVIAIPAPTTDELVAMQSRQLGKHKTAAIDEALKQLGDYVKFSSGTDGGKYWNQAGTSPKTRLLKISIAGNSTLSVSYTDSSLTIENAWRNGAEVTAEVESYGRMTKREAIERFQHLLNIEGIDGLKAPEGSPESSREKRENLKSGP